MESDSRSRVLVEAWLQPLPDPDEPCGKDLEYDNDFLELTRASQGKPETQFGPGEPPNWREVRELAEAMMARTRDLRIALVWVRASVNLDGFAVLAPGLQLLHGLLEKFWDSLHPMPDPDDGDPYSRANTLAAIPQVDGLLGDVRQCVFFTLRGTGELRVRAIAIALGQASALEGEASYTKEQLVQMIASAIEQAPDLREQPAATLEELRALISFINEKFGVENAPDMASFVELLKGVVSVTPRIEAAASQQEEAVTVEGASPRASKAALGQVSSREDALRAIDMVCEYLDRTEPTNPAQLLLRRARKLVNHNFLQLIKELAPDALSEAARVMGVDPESISLDNET
ncbi:MAG: type VI secretion system protein TssA [Burkholderiaceae bacterium]